MIETSFSNSGDGRLLFFIGYMLITSKEMITRGFRDVKSLQLKIEIKYQEIIVDKYMFLMMAYKQFTHYSKMINNKYFFSFRLEIGTKKKMDGRNNDSKKDERNS
ncbi:hypothetical protein V6Z12_A08G085500 [Gossypium hirsutum]